MLRQPGIDENHSAVRATDVSKAFFLKEETMLFAPAQVAFDCNFFLHFPGHRQDNHEIGGKIRDSNYRIKVLIKVKRSDSNYSCYASEANAVRSAERRLRHSTLSVTTRNRAVPAHSRIAVRYRAKPLIHNKNHDTQPRILKAR